MSEMLNLLSEISRGYYYFQMGLLFRNVKFINAVIVDTGVWKPFKDNDFKSLIEADKTLLRKILEAPMLTCT